MVVKLRYFAAAADAADREEESLTLEPGATIEDVRLELGARHGHEMTRVLGLCSFLLDGRVADPSAEISAGGARIDVLPPFAGG